MITDGDFASASNWDFASASDWTHDSTNSEADYADGSNASLDQTNANMVFIFFIFDKNI